MRHVDTFFNGHRRETFIEDVSILETAAGEERLKLALKLPLEGEALVGMPSWVGEPFALIAKTDFAVKSIASSVELDPMILRVFHLAETDTPAIQFDGVRLCGFKVERAKTPKDEDADIVLSFTAYLPHRKESLSFAGQNFRTSLFIRYEAAQMGLALEEHPAPKAASREEVVKAKRRAIPRVDDDGLSVQ